VATLRSPISPKGFLAVLPTVVAVCLATVAAPVAAREADPDGRPAGSLRIPDSIGSLGEPGSDDGGTPAAVVAAGINADVRLVADWNDPQPPSPATAAAPAPILRTAGETTPTAAPTTGFRRWIAERFAAVPPSAGAKPEAVVPPPAAARPTSMTAPVAGKPDEMPTLSIDPASFRGALPGRTSRAEVEASWGPGEASGEDDETLTWTLEPFERVDVTFVEDTVASIGIRLVQPMTVPDLARQLEIADLRTVTVRDAEGREIGDVYPERGVILSIEPETRQATAILIEPLDPEAFVLRAEGELESCSAFAVADLQYAVQIDPEHPRAHRLLLKMAAEQGKWTEALALAVKADRLNPGNPWVGLKHASVLLALDRPAEAREIVAGVQAGPDLPPLVAAQCQRLLGRVALAGAAPDHRAAVEHFNESIRLAAPLLSKRPQQPAQAVAREVLLDAHLGTALAIAAGTWQQKSRVIPKWLARAESLVKEFQGSEAERQILELKACRGTLAVTAASTEAIDPLPWVKRLLELRDAMAQTVTDPWRRRQIDWEVGQGLADALTAAQLRGDAADMLDNATLTAAYLERGSEHRELSPRERKQLGDLLFRIGILHSLQRGDHATAVTWFDRTIPLWDRNDQFQADGEFGRLGESYVSMAISYWQVERRDDALEIGRRGVDLMVRAVDAGQLDERALAVAYGNLATMYAERGDEERSKTYAEMASRAEASGSVVR